MQLLRPNPNEGAAGLRAMVTVARSRGDIPSPTRRLIEAGQKVLLGTTEPLDDLATITPEELAAAIERPEIRAQLVNGMVIASLSAGEPPPEQAKTIRLFADALHVRGHQLSAIEKIANHDVLFFKLCILRNGQIPDMIKNEYHHGGIRGVAKALARLRGLREDSELAAQFHAWEKLPSDSLGAHVYRHYRDNGFAFPGEPKGFPEAGIYHDFSHVLAGYDTTPEGETLVGGFIAGFRDSRPDHGLFTALFVLSIFSSGIDVTPVGVGASTGTVGVVAERFLMAIERGSAVSEDLSDNWNFWDYVELPLSEVRARLGIPPKTESGPGDSPL